MPRTDPLPRWQLALLAVLLLLPRLPGLSSPLLEDGHAYRQSATAMVARNFARHGYRLWLPEIDLVRRDESGGAKPGYTNLEFPLYPFAVALLYGLFGVHEWLGRLVAALCAVAAALILFRRVERDSGRWAGLVALAFFGLNPLCIFYSRAFLPEPMMLLFIALALSAAIEWADAARAGDPDRARRAWWTMVLAGTLAPLVKQPALQIVPALATAGFCARGGRAWRRADAWLPVLLPVVASWLWYGYANRLGAAYAGLFDTTGQGLIDGHLWLHGAANFYPRLRAVLLILVGMGSGPLALLCGLARPRRPADWILLAWLAGALAAIVVAAAATISHYYYNLALILALAPWIGRGAARFAWPPLRWTLTVLIVLGPLFVLTFPAVGSWYKIKRGEVQAAAAVRELTPPEDWVYTLCYGTQLLYAADRRGDFLLADRAFLDPAYLRDAAAAGYRWFATGRRELVDGPDGAALRDYLARQELVAVGPEYLVYRLRPEAP